MTVIHGLFAHPTPPVFDGVNNFHGRWNTDEVRFLADYVADADYIYDDSGTEGGLDDDVETASDHRLVWADVASK